MYRNARHSYGPILKSYFLNSHLDATSVYPFQVSLKTRIKYLLQFIITLLNTLYKQPEKRDAKKESIVRPNLNPPTRSFRAAMLTIVITRWQLLCVGSCLCSGGSNEALEYTNYC